MPIDRAGMLEAPINRNPARPPRFEPEPFWARGVASILENVEILPGEDVPVALKKRAAQMLRQRLEVAAVFGIVGVNGVVVEPRANEIVIARVVQFRPLEARRRHVINPQRLDPGVADVPRVRRAGHARHDSLPRVLAVRIDAPRAAVARSEELPLLQREVRQLVEADEQKLRALVLVNVVLVAAVAEARGRTVCPGHDVLRFAVALVKSARHVAAKVSEQRRFQLRIGPPKEQRVATRNLDGLANRFPQQGLRFSGARSPAKKTVLRCRFMKFLLPCKSSVIIANAQRTFSMCLRSAHPRLDSRLRTTVREASFPRKMRHRRR